MVREWPTSGMDVDWWSIRPLNGARDKGFEELCSQLARCEVPEGSRFVRKGAPDAGVECYGTLQDGTEWAWQAKYFHTLGASQWSQIDGSVRTALKKHPEIRRYIVCCPVDLPDGRSGKGSSARDRWDRYVAKWTGLATDAGVEVEFIYWGSHELLERLVRSEHSGRVRFWFGAPTMDAGWFARRVEEAVATAGARYTPELHINLPIAGEFEAFGRTVSFFDKTIHTVRELWSEWEGTCSIRSLDYRQAGSPDLEAEIRKLHGDSEISRAKKAAGQVVKRIVVAGSSIEVQPAGALPFHAVAEMIAEAEDAAENVARLISASAYSAKVVSAEAYRFRRFRETLGKARRALMDAERSAGGALMIVQGDAGTGKTHLLCDVARKRLTAGRPTVLMMGQRFMGTEDPWVQALAQLDMAAVPVDDFVGALESAAQAAGARALVMIDAVNEGRGSKLWPAHLPAFLGRLGRSEWIGVVLTIRSSYEAMIPAEVQSRAFAVRHAGFGRQSYRAVRAFFSHYGLSLASAPLFGPGFDNPLFLKAVCAGVQGKGMTELPRGSRGITAIFELYLSSVNDRLAQALGYPKRRPLVRNALHELAGAFASASEKWLPVEAASAAVDAHLPGRSYEDSLYQALVMEGVLIEEHGGVRTLNHDVGEVVFVAYDRLAEYLITEKLLLDHFDESEPTAAFKAGEALGFVLREEAYEVAGYLEALCVRLPEVTGREVVDLVPDLAEAIGFEDAFTKSLTWRDVQTLSGRTRELVLERLGLGRGQARRMVEALLTIATVPDHPLNAEFLDTRLRKDDMPARDAWWSASLSGASSNVGPTRQLLDWALGIEPSTSLDDAVTMLSTVSLSWLLTAPDPGVRNTATRALVNLLSGRIAAAVRLVERFAGVDDQYVLQHIYAVAYGVATRSYDAQEAGELAACVYSHVFAAGAPPADIMLRDYARGVVEWALHLESPVEVDETLLRPPYNSPLPTFPSERDILQLLPGADHNPHEEKKDADWSRRQIGYSVMQGRMHDVIRQRLTKGEWLSARLGDRSGGSAGAERGEASPGSFDRGEIERYVLWRVFELGWTAELFGGFDSRWNVDGMGAGGSESFGTKYQRIAYSEVLGLVADHFEYRKPGGEGRPHCDRYDGPWQLGLRTLDPTWPPKGSRGGDMTGREGHPGAWWTGGRYEGWEEAEEKLGDWVRRTDDFPDAARILTITDPTDGTNWLNCGSSVVWRQRPPVGRELFETLRGKLTYWVTAHLVRQADVQAVMEVARGGSFLRAAATPYVDQVFMGEHAWSPASAYVGAEWRVNRRLRLSESRTVWTRPASVEYIIAGHGVPRFDSRLVRFPGEEIVERGRLRWCARGADFLDAEGRRAAYDPSAHAVGPSMLLLRRDWATEFLSEHGVAMVWCLSGEKSVELMDPAPGYRQLEVSGVYVWTESGPDGFVRHQLSEPVPAGGWLGLG